MQKTAVEQARLSHSAQLPEEDVVRIAEEASTPLGEAEVTTQATEIINDGDLVRVDGTQGIVEIVERATI